VAVAPGKVGRRGSHRRWPAAMQWRKWSDTTAFGGGGGALVVGEGVDEVLQLEKGTWEVRRGPKGVDEGGHGGAHQRREKQRRGGAKTAWRRL
jgi:hypothetical protein